MSLIDDITSASSAAKSALSSPVSAAGKAAGIDLQAAKLGGAGSGILDVYEQHGTLINNALGLPPAHSEYIGEFADLLDGNPDNINVGSQVTDSLRSKLTVVNTATEALNKATAAQASANQALACLNIDIPDVAGAITDTWNTMNTYIDKAMGFVEDSINNGIAYIQDLAKSLDTSAFKLNTPAWVQDNLDKLQALYDKAKSMYQALCKMKDKVVDYIKSSELYKTTMAAIQKVVEVANKAISAVAGALACAPSVMGAIGDGAAVVGVYNPSMMHALDAVNSKKLSILQEAGDTLDTADDNAVSRLLGKKQAEVFSVSKKAVFKATGMDAAVGAATEAKGSLLAHLGSLNSKFSF